MDRLRASCPNCVAWLFCFSRSLPCMARFLGTDNSARHRPTINPSNELTRGDFAHYPRSNCWIILRGPCWYPRVLLEGNCDDIIVEFPISCGQQRWALEPHDTRRAPEGAPGWSSQEDEVILDNPGCSPAASTSRCLLPDRAQIQATVALPCKVLAAPAADSSCLYHIELFLAPVLSLCRL